MSSEKLELDSLTHDLISLTCDIYDLQSLLLQKQAELKQFKLRLNLLVVKRDDFARRIARMAKK